MPVMAAEPQFDGDKVFIDDAYVYLSAQPHTIGSSGWITLEFKSKVYTGNVDIALGFNQTYCKPTKIQLWKNYSHPIWKQIGEFVPFPWQDENGTWYNETVEYGWVNESYFDWIDWNISVNPIDFDYQSFNKWYYSLNLPVVAGVTYKARIYLKVPFSGLGNSTGKYYFAIKPSSETIQQAIANGHFYYLDPWWNSNWKKRTLVAINKDYISELLINFPIGINCSSFKANCSSATGADIRFIGIDNSTEYFYELENWSSNNPIAWVNITRVFSSEDTAFYIYMNNSLATDNQTPTKVWDGYYAGVWHMNDSTKLWDSTANHYSSSSTFGTTSIATCKWGFGVDFTANGGFNFGDVLDMGTSLFSVEGYFMSGGFAAGTSRILGKYDGPPGYEVCVQSGSNRELWHLVYDGSNIIWNAFTADTTMDNAIWRNFWVRMSSSTTSEELVDKLWWHTSDPTAAVGNVDNAYPFAIGYWPGSAAYFPGRLDELRLSMVARNDSWLNATFYNGNQTNFLLRASNENYTPPPTWINVTTIYPLNESTEVCPIDVICLEFVTTGISANIIIYSNVSGSWLPVTTVYNYPAGYYCISINNFTTYNITYYWYANITDYVTATYFNQTGINKFTASSFASCSGAVGSTTTIGSNIGVVGVIGIFGILVYFFRRRNNYA